MEAMDCGAAYIGFNFYRRSPRFVTLDIASQLTSQIKRGVTPVGLFVDPSDAELEGILSSARLEMIQLHGEETPERVDEVKALTGLPVMKALGISTARDLRDAQAYEGHADWLLFDAKPPEDAALPGGNGVAFDWALLKNYSGHTPWMLAGGLVRSNVIPAIKASGAQAVDVSSGVETEPGVKSPAKIRSFLAAVNSLAAKKA